jgi:hypothetical protein
MWVVYVKNLDPTAIITVQVQPAGGALPSAVNSPKLPPGAVYIYWSPLETSGGIVGVTLISSVGNTPVEVLLAAIQAVMNPPKLAELGLTPRARIVDSARPERYKTSMMGY